LVEVAETVAAEVVFVEVGKELDDTDREDAVEEARVVERAEVELTDEEAEVTSSDEDADAEAVVREDATTGVQTTAVEVVELRDEETEVEDARELIVVEVDVFEAD
jgi:hypothetical protein